MLCFGMLTCKFPECGVFGVVVAVMHMRTRARVCVCVRKHAGFT